MALFADYTGLRQGVLQLIEGDDLSQSSFSLSTADLMIGLGETRVYRDLRTTAMLASLSVVVTSNSAPLPSSFLELSEVYFTGKPPLEIITLERLRGYEADGITGTSTTRYCAQDGDNLRFYPPATGTVIGGYYTRPTLAMKDETSWALQTTVARYPECFLFAALVEACTFLGFDARVPVWEQKYQRSVGDAMDDERQRVYGGSFLRIRPR